MAKKFIITFSDGKREVKVGEVPLKDKDKRKPSASGDTVTVAYGKFKQGITIEGEPAYIQLTVGQYKQDAATVVELG